MYIYLSQLQDDRIACLQKKKAISQLHVVKLKSKMESQTGNVCSSSHSILVFTSKKKSEQKALVLRCSPSQFSLQMLGFVGVNSPPKNLSMDNE